MSFELSREHEDFRHNVRDFVKAEVAPYAAERRPASTDDP